MARCTPETRSLSKRFGDRTAAAELSFAAQKGDVVGMLGANAGFPSTRPNDIRRRVGVLPESSGCPGHQTRREYPRFHARLFGLSRLAPRTSRTAC
jgi:ABC-2 type transport system ATP-binding protein